MASAKKITQESAMKAVEAAYGAASEFLGHAWDLQRNVSNREQLNAAADSPKQALCYAAASIRWFDLHSLLTSQVREFGREARARTGEPVRIGAPVFWIVCGIWGAVRVAKANA